MTESRKWRTVKLEVSLQSLTTSQKSLKLHAAMSIEADHLTVKVKIMLTKSTLYRLIDFSVTVNFISSRFVKNNKLNPEALHAFAVWGVNNKVLTKASFTGYYKLSTRVSTIINTSLFYILDLQNYNIILRLPWLKAKNSDINWITDELSSCEGKERLCSCNFRELLRNLNQEDTVIVINLYTLMIDSLISKEYEDYADVFLREEAFKLSSECSDLNMNI